MHEIFSSAEHEHDFMEDQRAFLRVTGWGLYFFPLAMGAVALAGLLRDAWGLPYEQVDWQRFYLWLPLGTLVLALLCRVLVPLSQLNRALNRYYDHEIWPWEELMADLDAQPYKNPRERELLEDWREELRSVFQRQSLFWKTFPWWELRPAKLSDWLLGVYLDAVRPSTLKLGVFKARATVFLDAHSQMGRG